MIALCVGHSRPNDSGASSVTGVSEWDYNSELAEMIGDKLRQPYKVYSTYKGNGYVSAMPACIAEPFFGSNQEDWELALKHKDGVADAIAGGLTLYKELAERW